MQKTTLLVGVIAIIFSASTASAQSFTFKSDQTSSSQFGGTGASGMEGLGGHTQGKVTFTDASGDNNKGSYECVSMASPKNSKLFDMHVSCNVETKDGDFALILGCTVMGTEGEAACVGGMKGKTGMYENKYGNFSQQTKGDKGMGSGQWFE